jgi:hypothetical protein
MLFLISCVFYLLVTNRNFRAARHTRSAIEVFVRVVRIETPRRFMYIWFAFKQAIPNQRGEEGMIKQTRLPFKLEMTLFLILIKGGS